ncbi:hypothetical protein chiPu_0007152 [Chiloscyllium punctatum]|uniref:Uncharacterized protein n=1 Tax=Chiloscyllium punctatum TaxID=137246 RepID=A0A401SEB1_CHIPU|nr:hypothetical protein [Chiloscyllium punctatum]
MIDVSGDQSAEEAGPPDRQSSADGGGDGTHSAQALIDLFMVAVSQSAPRRPRRPGLQSPPLLCRTVPAGAHVNHRIAPPSGSWLGH